ncbi:MAG: polymer-forming cytoskeletal protein [Deltaproteobacteria bacterium]|nr:MAG: polymer-forming cytoskeletal protein [Deltaproteobacteria bacterium]
MMRDIVSRPERAPEQPLAAPHPPAPAATPPAPAAPRSSAASTFLDATSAFEGVIRSSEPLRLDGRVKGEIHCEDSVVIGRSARIEATIRADAIVIAGEVRGEAHAARKLTLAATARMEGQLTTPAIVIEEGAELIGRIQIGVMPPPSELQPDRDPATAGRPGDTRRATPSATSPPPG